MKFKFTVSDGSMGRTVTPAVTSMAALAAAALGLARAVRRHPQSKHRTVTDGRPGPGHWQASLPISNLGTL